MPKIYATKDSDGPNIEEGAHIHAFETESEAKAFLMADYKESEWDRATARIEPGSFGDAWHKRHKAPRVGDTILSPFSYAHCVVLRPGQHPGGKVFWITPKAEVLTLAAITERA